MSWSLRAAVVASVGAVALSFTGCAGPGGACAEGEVEHPYDQRCVATCDTDADCDGETPVCQGGGSGDAGSSGGNALFDGICGCNADSCGAGEVCNDAAGVCVDNCDPFVDPNADGGDTSACPVVDGDGWSCSKRPGVTGYVCQEPCVDNDDCPSVGDEDRVCDQGDCVALCDNTGEPLRLVCPDDDCNVQTGLCGGGCTNNDGCGGATPICDVANGVCVACMESSECFPSVCNVASGECVDCMNSDECGAKVCDVASGDCVDCMMQNECGENADCNVATGDCFAACTTIGPGDEVCEAEEVCQPGDPVNTCEDACEQQACISGAAGTDQVCQPDTEEAAYNTCVAPDDANNACGRVEASAHARDDGGPVVASVEFVMQDADDGNCTGSVGRYQALVYSADAVNTGAPYTQAVKTLNINGGEALSFGTVTTIEEAAGMPDYYDVVFTLCETNNDGAGTRMGADLIYVQYAFYLIDDAGDKSQAWCFDSGIFPPL